MHTFISIIIVNWNGRKWLKRCLDSLVAQRYKDFEIIFVDNASTDDSVDFVQKNYPSVILIRNTGNLGFAGGNNIGLTKSRGQYILLLNNDTWVEQDYLEHFIQAFDEIPNVGAVQSKIVLMDQPNMLDSCGSYWSDSTFLYHYGFGKDQTLEKYNTPMPVFSNKGASMLIRRDLIDRYGLFDEDFWCYYEETDFCHRLWIAGYECWYYPKALAHHAMGGTAVNINRSSLQFHNVKNKLLSFLKNFEFSSLVRILPIHIAFTILFSIILFFQGKSTSSFALYRAIFWNMRNIRMTIKKRRFIQKIRKKTDQDIFLSVRRNPSLWYYYYLLTGLEQFLDS